MITKKINVLLTGVCYFKGMASTNRIHNLLEPLISEDKITLKNLIANKGLFLDDISSSGVVSDIEYIYCGKGLKNPLIFIYQTIRGMIFLIKSKKKNSLNILYCYQSPDITNILYLLLSKIIGFKLIIDITEDVSLSKQSTGIINKVKSKFTVLFEKIIPYIADTCIGITQHLVSKLNVICNNKVPVFHIPITLDFDKINDVEKIKSLDEKLIIFYGGSFTERDGIYSLIEVFDIAATTYPNLYLKITGDTNISSLKSILLDNIAKCKNKNRILLTGFLSYDDYIKNLNEADICCVPRSKSEYSDAGFPSKLGEFLASANPVIASNTGDISLYLENKKNSFLIEPGSNDELLQQIIYIIKNREESEKIGKNGRITAFKFFDSKTHAKNLLDIFINLN